MKLNPDCIRDIMMFCVDNTFVMDEHRIVKKDSICFASFHVLHVDEMAKTEKMRKYPFGELTYHVIQLSESGFLATDFSLDTKDRKTEFLVPVIYYVTPKGYDFVAASAEKTQWEKSKSILAKLGGVSMSVMEKVVANVTSTAINQLMGKG